MPLFCQNCGSNAFSLRRAADGPDAQCIKCGAIIPNSTLRAVSTFSPGSGKLDQIQPAAHEMKRLYGKDAAIEWTSIRIWSGLPYSIVIAPLSSGRRTIPLRPRASPRSERRGAIGALRARIYAVFLPYVFGARAKNGRNPGVPTGIRTPVCAVRGRRPGPLDDGDIARRMPSQ